MTTTSLRLIPHQHLQTEAGSDETKSVQRMTESSFGLKPKGVVTYLRPSEFVTKPRPVSNDRDYFTIGAAPNSTTRQNLEHPVKLQIETALRRHAQFSSRYICVAFGPPIMLGRGTRD
jgi:hypothetical protein